MLTFGQRLRNLRTERGYTKEDLASLLKISFSSIEKYEADNRTPTLKKAEKIASFFGMSVDELLGESVLPKEMMRKRAALALKYASTIDALERMDPGVRSDLLKRIESAAELFQKGARAKES